VSISSQERLNYWHLDGTVQAEDILGAMAAMASDPAFEPSFNTLVHVHRDADLASLNLALLQETQKELAAKNAKLRGDQRVRVAILSNQASNRTIAVLWQALADATGSLNIEYKVFEEESEAREWLSGEAA
jgi:FMN phosphatase YigB (HAD superfamily)